MRVSRLTYEESCRRLEGADKVPPMPDHLPQWDDEVRLGMSFFRRLVDGGIDFRNLTLPRTFFGRSEMRNVSFENTDLSESNFCWNDFIKVDFTDSLLTRSDMRSSNFEEVRFVRADLRSVDMRRSWFANCIFDGALMEGAVLTRAQAVKMSLSREQREFIAWRNDDGPEPGGG
jgi:uncharacterized protein YjbI with pentapeptide repeats